MSKHVEYSTDFKTWKVVGEWTDDEASENWKKLQQWICDEQPYGFFRLVNIEVE